MWREPQQEAIHQPRDATVDSGLATAGAATAAGRRVGGHGHQHQRQRCGIEAEGCAGRGIVLEFERNGGGEQEQ